MTRWYTEKKREHFYKEAKRVGYRARSAFKLLQIQQRFHLFSPGDCIIDLGAAPGGWTQVAHDLVGPNGCIISIDINAMAPLDNTVHVIRGDIADEETKTAIDTILQGSYADSIISDMSPDISGTYSIDQARSVYLCTQALTIAERFLKPHGHFICKLFEGEDTQHFLQQIRNHFTKVQRYAPPASRKSSSETYIIATSYRRNP